MTCSTVFVAVCALWIAEIASAATQDTQDQVVAVITDYELPPATLDAAWKRTQIVGRGQIQSSAVRERVAGRQPVPLAVTEHRVKLLEILKGAPAIAASGQSAFGVTWGGGGAFRLLGNDAIVPGAAQRMWQFREQLTRDEFLYALRSRREDERVK